MIQSEAHFPGESAAYRSARDELLAAEMDLRRQIEAVAALRRALPPGGALKEDYRFHEAAADESVRPMLFSALFGAGRTTLVAYSLMYAEGGQPCPMCTAFLDGLDGNAQHLDERIALVVIGKAPAADLRRWADARGWRHLRLLSSGGTSFNADYHAETPDGAQWPLIHVFQNTPDGIVHRYSSEMFYAAAEAGQQPRHADMMWPLWNVLDLTPEGRGTDWIPVRSYQRSLAAVADA